MGQLVILSGPSCVGKGPLHAALRKFHPHLEEHLQKLILYNSRSPRPNERDGVDYHFRSRSEIQGLRERASYVVTDVRGDLQALDLEQLRQITRSDRNAFFEGNPFVVMELLRAPLLANVPKLSLFLAPLSREEILFLRHRTPAVSLPDFVADVMRRKLLRRTRKQKETLSLQDLQDIERRATSAYQEMQLAWRFDHVIPNHDGEDSEHWDAFYYPIGDARRTLLAFATLLGGQATPYAERWEQDLLPDG